MVPQKVSDLVLNDLNSFVSKTYSNDLPNSLLIAQAFILKYPDYGNKFGLSELNRMIEDGIKQGLFNHTKSCTHEANKKYPEFLAGLLE
jgi:hypothetical protein